MEQKTDKEDEWYWELLEEQHNHDVRISGAQEGENGGESDSADTGQSSR